MARSAALVVALLLLFAAAARAAPAAGWQRPIQLAAPVQLDVFGTHVGIASDGSAAVGYGIENVDSPASARAYALQRAATGKLTRPRRFSGLQQVLALAFSGVQGELLTGTSPAHLACCSSVQAVPLTGGRAQTLVKGLAGATEARLIAFGGQLLAAVGTERGVWVAQGASGRRFGSARRLSTLRVLPEVLDAAADAGGRSVVAFAAGPTPSDVGSIFVARGSAKAPPQRSREEITLSPSHSVDELSVAAGAQAPIVAWIESWSDARGAFHSQAMVADLTQTIHPRALSSSRELAAGLTIASNAKGEQAVAWKACNSAGACALRAALRAAGHRFGATQRLSPIDASEEPAVSVSPPGERLLAWVHDGHVLAAASPRGAARFGATHTVSATNFATDLTLTFGPTGTALAVWTQGTLAQAVMGAIYVTG